ncbi:MAG: C4-dicarboxylate ABC transporter permease [Paracoccaceae bacterium]|nr:MAG: C4-dicarboxylate ABC transporter permease [Paracoccaceae bacterium]
MSAVLGFSLPLLIGVPIVFVLGIMGLWYVWDSGLPTLLVPQRLFVGLNSFLILGVPLFILTGNIMNAMGATDRIVAFANLVVGRFRGGLAYVALVAIILFSAVVGAGAAAASAVGATLIPAMKRAGHSAEQAASLVAAGATIGPIIPPSIAMIVYGAIANVSIAALFVGGIIPGLLFGLALALVVRFKARMESRPEPGEGPGAREVLRIFAGALPGLAMPVIVLGGMLAGIFTPTEAAGVSVAYALIVGFGLYRTLTLGMPRRILKETAVMAGGVMLVVATASLFSWILAAERIPQQAATLFAEMDARPILLLIVINLLLLLVGCIIETLAAIIVLTPVLLPIVTAAGIDPLHFGIIMVVNLSIGLATPPVGVNLFVSAAVAQMSLLAVARQILPYLGALLAILLLLMLVPDLSLMLPRLLGSHAGP